VSGCPFVRPSVTAGIVSSGASESRIVKCTPSDSAMISLSFTFSVIHVTVVRKLITFSKKNLLDDVMSRRCTTNGTLCINGLRK